MAMAVLAPACPVQALLPTSSFVGVTDQLAHLSRNFADVHRQLSALSFAANTTADWMCQQDACAFDIDKSFSSLRERLEANARGEKK